MSSLFDIAPLPLGDDYKDAFKAGELRSLSKQFGLSLGDRACLATAYIEAIPVWTADRIWFEVADDVAVKLIR